MRAARWYNNSDVRVEEMPVPHIGPGELLVRVEASGLCGSDVMEWYRIDRAPLVLGHEIGGTIVGVGKGVEKYKKGDRITAAHHVPCNTCHYCLSGRHTVCDTLRRTNFDPGGLAEFLRLPAINVASGVFPLPDSVTFDEATFVEPLACILRGQRLAHLQPGQNLLVMGSGISGLLHIRMARALGAGFIMATDVSDFRLKVAKQSGADIVLPATDYSPEYFRKAAGQLADLVIVCTGAAPAIEQALKSVERGGTVLFFAPTGPNVIIPLSINDLFWRNDVTLTTSYAGAPTDYAAALELIRARRVPVTDLITHRLPLAETGIGFQLVAKAQDSIKVIIEPQR